MKLAPLLFTLALVPVSAAEPVPPVDVVCNKGWCAVRADTLKGLIEHMKKLSDHSEQLRILCGWKDK